MNSYDERMADYLAGTLSDTDRQRLEQEVAGNPALRAELDALRETEATLRDALVPLEEAERAVARIQEPTAQRRNGLATGQVVAVLLLGFALGFWSRGAGGPAAQPADAPEPVAMLALQTDSSFARLADRFQTVSVERPQMSRFGRGLLALRSGQR